MSVFGTSTLRRGLCVFALAAICAWSAAPQRSAAATAPSLPAASDRALYATLLPAAGEVETPQLAVRWPGRPGAALSVSLGNAGRYTPLVADRVLDTGANLVALPLPAGATGTIRLLIRDVTGRVLHRSTRDLGALRQTSAFGWPAGDTRAAAAPGLYAGGNFTQAGGAAVDRLATWNGSAWSRLGAGPDGSVTALVVYDGDLIAGGSFLTAGGVRVNGIARWDGTTWSPLTGSSGTGVMTTSLDFVDALTVFDGDLIVGGQFLRAGGVAVNHIARWDGAEWWPLAGSGGTGVDVPSVWDLTVHDGALIVAGGFSQAGGTAANRIARWTGSAWSTLGTGFNGDVLALAVFDGALVATGGFTQAGGTAAGYVAEWTGGGWAALGAGLNAEGRALTVFGAALVVGGTFTEAGGAAANYLARWDGSGWSALGGGTEDIVLALSVHDGRLIAGGFFTRAGGVAVNHVAGWNGSAWSALGGTAGVGTDAGVYALHTV
ncbi:hypothetical protein [Plantactinospora sp. KLBMP9567]|uniref:hypothetical protein n=1 Tax=Plantactinospora sp. KLBMP9567 TaxID=3085900 RepID=UPI002980C64B|nr:hypothetical protein [Plantactinospora sp. KLBMP9567]MDW5325132.1 hypothetical protein [Plantactinospora sp. KLBMP9567]MDW5329333.1 hypothetical protein [Plantactinospora sp. KLBMP9567]